MPDFYYMDLYFDPESSSLVDTADACVNAIIQSGCEFRKIIIPSEPEQGKTSGGSFAVVGLEHLRPTCQICQDEMLASGTTLFSYPPRWGRIVFEHAFETDGEQADEVYDEEQDTGAQSREMGLSFQFFNHEGMGRKIKMTISFWEDFILKRASDETCQRNIGLMARMIETISYAAAPYFGAMNTELRINTDHSLDLLLKGELPEGNEFVFVGGPLCSKVNMDALDSRRIAHKDFSDGSLLIQFASRFDGLRAF